jgi:hypothetical protein
MLYQYGYFKPLIALKLGKPATLRQFGPPVFVLALLGSALLAPFANLLGLLFLATLGLHTIVNVMFSAALARREGWRLFPALMAGFFVGHFAYGFGYLRGIVDFALLKKHRRAPATDLPLSR